ncbi:MAG: ATP synthase subunit I [Burkholderiales bacterium]|nr:ATP synthase subunit I [Burkholderiales bacterium]
MQVHETWTWLLAGLAGAALGAFFFGGLWWTVRRTLQSGRSLALHFGGFLLRMAVTLAGFYLVGAGQWQRLAACLAGFIVARALVLRVTRSTALAVATSAPEARHAPQP